MREWKQQNAPKHLLGMGGINQQSYARMFHSNHLFSISALAQCVQPGQGFHRSSTHGGPQRQDDSPSGPEAPVGGQHGSLFLHEEPAPFHLAKPSQEGVFPLPEHQVRTVHPFQPLHQIQQITAGSRTGAARAQPALPAAVHWLSTGLGPARRLSKCLLCGVAVQYSLLRTHSVRNNQVPPSLPPGVPLIHEEGSPALCTGKGTLWWPSHPASCATGGLIQEMGEPL